MHAITLFPKKLWMLFPLLGAVVGCSHDPIPQAQIELTEQAVAQAQTVGATVEQPSMQLAIEKLARAQKNLTEQDYKRARMLAEQAELDARLAELQALVRNSQVQTQELKERADKLRQQLGAQP